MNYPTPNTEGFTIYTKTNCAYCDKVKSLLTSSGHEYTAFLCDEYLNDDKIAFLEFIESIAEIPYNTFPMVFHNSKFVGGYNDTMKYIAFI